MDAYSYICRHGLKDHEYGSGPLRNCLNDTSHFGENHMKDWVWGLHRAQILCLWFLATKEKPLLEENNA